MLYSVRTSQPFDTVVDRLTRAVADHHFGVIETIDLQKKMNAKGVPFEAHCSILEVCNPHKAKEALEQNMSISTALPCRISVYEEDGVVVVSTSLPTKLLVLFDDSESMQAIAREVEGALIGIIGQACAQAVAS